MRLMKPESASRIKNCAIYWIHLTPLFDPIRMRLKIVVLLLLCHTIACFGQEPNSIQFSTKNGLTSSEIYDVIQDDWGYLWVSSDHGLNRFDGFKFEQYSTEDGLTDNTVFRFKKDQYGRIWCTTYNNTLFLIEGPECLLLPTIRMPLKSYP